MHAVLSVVNKKTQVVTPGFSGEMGFDELRCWLRRSALALSR